MTDTPAERGAAGWWGALRRRKVVQWTVAYAAGAWVTLQVLGFAADTYAWPAIVAQLAMLGLAVGFPVVVTLAWFHGERSQQRVSGRELAILTALLFIGGGLLWWYADRRAATPAATVANTPTNTADADARPSIAVLPFENRSRHEDDVFFVDGIHDDILMQLTKIGAMKVIARTSVEQFRNTKLTTTEIGEKLGVTRVLEGGVQRAGDRVRVTVQLIDTASDAHLWAESYDRELTAATIFAIQRDVATAIAGALNTTLTPAEKARVNSVPTQNLDAWQAYQLGKQRMAKRRSAALAEAEKFFQKAIDLDPKFALAYVGLADTLTIQADFGAPRDASFARAEKAAGAALELDPNLAEAWACSANIASFNEQYDRAERMFRHAIELNPNYATAYHWFSAMLGSQGRADEALDYAERAATLDPLSAIINLLLGVQLDSVGRFDEAEARYRKVIEIDPSMPHPYLGIGLLAAYVRNGFSDAVPFLEKAMELDPGDPSNPCTLAMLYLDLGDDSRAARFIEFARVRWPDYDFVLWVSARVHAVRGNQDAALQDAHRLLALEPHDSTALNLLGNADLQSGHPDVARARYAKAYPELLVTAPPTIDGSNWLPAIDLARVLQKTGESASARILLDRSEQVIRTIPRLGVSGYGIADVQNHALRGQKSGALSALRAAEQAGWRGPAWRYFRDFDPNLASIRSEPEFKAVFADIERDMAQQRARLAARPKDAPLELTGAR